MAIGFAFYAGKSESGKGLKKNEDYITFTELGQDALLATVADGAGSQDAMFQPAAVVANHVSTVIRRIFEENGDLLFQNMGLFLKLACMSANDNLIAFKVGDEEKNGGFATTITGCLIHRSGRSAFMHAGNSRLFLIRDGKILQFSKDQTEGQDLVDRGFLTQEQYYTAVERLRLKNGIGIVPEPYITAHAFTLQKNDLLVLTTDGVHYAIRQEAMKEIIFRSPDVDAACTRVMKIAQNLGETYVDNLSIELIQFLGGEDEKKE